MTTAVCEALLDAITARDCGAIEACFADDARFDVLTPHRLREHRSAAEAAERYRAWLAPLERFEVLARDAVVVADRVRIRYLFRGRDPKSGWQLNEHTGYAAVEDGRIASMTMTCAGFRPIPEPT
jgi:hypothetical protein